MTRDELLDILRRLAQNGVVPGPPDSGCETGCAWCHEEVPNGPCHYDDSDDVKHFHGCSLAKAIAWLEEEGNKELVDDRSNGSENKGVWWGWVLR